VRLFLAFSIRKPQYLLVKNFASSGFCCCYCILYFIASIILRLSNVFGIVSTRPAYLMNAKQKRDKNAMPIAVAGRIPVKVKGVVNRGDRLMASDIPGIAQSAPVDAPAWSIVGRSLGNFNGEGIGKVEATVGVR
jgi:hypothetical protein